ncbi:MAG: hypothetical protein GY799_26680 [Desulfobulbaceae bacterium]|nr:hypothetical protein [Desulfobulbaceae bacterium]
MPTVRMQIQVAQGNKCPLCKANFGDGKLVGKRIVPKYTPVLDHNHDNGRLRGVLCNNCNGMEGKIKNRVRRASRDLSDIEWLENLLTYWKLHVEPRSPYTYPTHKTADDKRIARNKKARLRRAQAKAAEQLKDLK